MKLIVHFKTWGILIESCPTKINCCPLKNWCFAPCSFCLLKHRKCWWLLEVRSHGWNELQMIVGQACYPPQFTLKYKLKTLLSLQVNIFLKKDNNWTSWLKTIENAFNQGKWVNLIEQNFNFQCICFCYSFCDQQLSIKKVFPS